MAIEAAYRDQHGTDHPTAYHRVTHVELRPDGAQIIVAVYPSKAASDERLPPMANLIFNAGMADAGPDDVDQVADDPDDPKSPTHEVRTPTVVDNLGAHFGRNALATGSRNPRDAASKAAYAFIKAGTTAQPALTGTDV